MELDNIYGLELYVDREIETNDGKTVVRRMLLEDDLEIGEAGYFSNDCRNKIVKHGEQEYIFYRFDEVQTHIEDYDSDYSIDDIGKYITNNFDYSLEYSEERVKLIKSLIEDNQWVYDLLSSNRIIQKEQKTNNCYLAENQKLDSYFQRMVDYILHPKFNNKEEEKYYKDLKSEYNKLRKKRSKTNSDIKKMFILKEDIDLFDHFIMSKRRQRRNKKREGFVEDFAELELKEHFETNFFLEKSYISPKKLKIDNEYWSKMGFSEEDANFRKQILNTYEEALSILSKQLGHGRPKSEKEKIQKKLLESFNTIKFNNGKRTVVITPQVRLNKLNKMYSELKSDYNKTKEILANIVSFSHVEPTSTKYDFNTDTWYETNVGEIVELSKNTILFNNIKTYKGLIVNYNSLKDKYKDNFDSDMWYILLYFEELIKNTDFSNEEKFVLNGILKDYTRKEIAEDFEKFFGKTISMYSISNMINKTIPNKILNTYLNSVDEWLYTYKIKGKFKKCARCNEIKLISNNRYFGKDSRNRDGFKSICKKCDNYTKKPK